MHAYVKYFTFCASITCYVFKTILRPTSPATFSRDTTREDLMSPPQHPPKQNPVKRKLVLVPPGVASPPGGGDQVDKKSKSPAVHTAAKTSGVARVLNLNLVPPPPPKAAADTPAAPQQLPKAAGEQLPKAAPPADVAQEVQPAVTPTDSESKGSNTDFEDGTKAETPALAHPVKADVGSPEKSLAPVVTSQPSQLAIASPTPPQAPPTPAKASPTATAPEASPTAPQTSPPPPKASPTAPQTSPPPPKASPTAPKASPTTQQTPPAATQKAPAAAAAKCSMPPPAPATKRSQTPAVSAVPTPKAVASAVQVAAQA